MEEMDIYKSVNPDDVEDILKKVSLKKLPQREVEEAQADVKDPKEEKLQEIVKEDSKNETASQQRISSQTVKQNNNFLPKEYKRGDIITVTVVKIEPNGIYVSAQTKEDIFIPLRGLTNKPVSSPEEILKVGDKIDVMVLGNGSNLVFSKKFADVAKI